MFSMILEDRFEELGELELCSVNGGTCTGGRCTSGGYSSGYTGGSSSGSCTSVSYAGGSCTSASYTTGSCTSGSYTTGGYAGGSCTTTGNGAAALSAVKTSINDNFDKLYNSDGDGYRCDNWVEEVLNDAGYSASDYLTAGKASEKTVQQHIDALKKSGKDYTTEVPTKDGVYVVFMDNVNNGKTAMEHTGIMVVENNIMTLYDNSSGNKGGKGGVEGTLVTAKTSTQISAFLYDTYYFQQVK